MERILKKDLYVLIFLISLTIILRFFSFFPTVIDHDESTYLVIGNEISKGKILYKDITDIKPVGIFYIVAGFLKIFGRTIIGFRLFGSVVIACTSFILYKAKIKMGHEKNVAFAAGAIYIFFLSIWTFFGVSLNTEHFFNFFTALSVLFLFRNSNNNRIYLVSFFLGLGFLIKIMVAFDQIAIFLFLIVSDLLDKKLSWKKTGSYFLAGIVFLLPFGIVNLVYYLSGNFGYFFHINYLTFINYPADERDLAKIGTWFFFFFIRFLPITYFYFHVLFSKESKRSVIAKEKLFGIIWFLLTAVSVLFPGKPSGHYFIQIMLPMSMLAANIFSRGISKPTFLQKLFHKRIGYPLLILLIIGNVTLQKKDYYPDKNYPDEVAEYLEQNLKDNEVIYMGNGHQIIYFLIDRSSPTKYVHRSLIYSPGHCQTLNIDPDAEIQKILDQSPRYILMEKKGVSNRVLDEALDHTYYLAHTFQNGNVLLYEKMAP